MKKQNVLVIGGMHGDEPTGIEVVKYFQLHPARGIDAFLGNSEASKRKKRCIETDLNRSFQPKIAVSLEEKIAEKLKLVIKQYDFVVDIHNTRGDYTTCAITTMMPNALHLSLTNHFGFSRLVVMPPSGSLIAENPTRAISLEIALNEQKTFSDMLLIDKIQTLSQRKKATKPIEIYKFVRSIPTATLLRVGIQPKDVRNFKQLSQKQYSLLYLDKTKIYCPIFAKKKFGKETGFDLVEKL